MSLRQILADHGIQQRELAVAVGLSEASVSRIVKGERALPRKPTLDAILAWLSRRLGRPVTYEETFPPAEPTDEVVAPASEAS